MIDGSPSVSVIVPVLNAESTVRELMESLVRIEYDREKLEIIIVDGNSVDRTRDIIGEYRVELIVENKKGINAARNTGIKSSNGDIIVFTDSDCVVPKDWIKKIVANFKEPNVGCLGGNAEKYSNDFISKYADSSVFPVLRRFKKREVLDRVELLFRYPAGCNMAFKREAYNIVGGFDEGVKYSFDEDEFVERVCEAGYKQVLDPNVTIKHQHRSNLKSLLEQMFNYGRGGGFILRTNSQKEISKWIRVSMLLFIVWLASTVILFFGSIYFSIFCLIPLSIETIIPFLLLTFLYVWKSLKTKEFSMLTYSTIDFLRIFAFCFGEISGFILK